MTIQFASDLHLEFPENKQFLRKNPLQPQASILLLAGDIVPFRQLEQHGDFFSFCSDHFEKTYWIAGNHEYYLGNLSGKTGPFVEEVAPQVFLVNNHSVAHHHVQIILSTLWTPISKESQYPIQNSLNDYHLIKEGEKRFSPERSSQLFEENLKYLTTALANKAQEKCIVVTHHVPTFNHYPQEYQGSVLNQAFAVDLNTFIESAPIDYWIYGHHHRNVPPFKIGSTKLMTNQLGYVKYGEQKGFSATCLLEV